MDAATAQSFRSERLSDTQDTRLPVSITISQGLLSRLAGRSLARASRRAWLGRALLLGTLLYSAGCSSDSDIGRVEGIVTLDGQPLPKATVVFIQGQGRPAGGITDEEGRYVLNYAEGRKGALPGVNRVRITTAQGPSETPDGQPVPAVPERIPTQFNTESTLEFEVVAGEVNVANFDLVSKGKIAREDGG
jgi:hypothetical protein